MLDKNLVDTAAAAFNAHLGRDDGHRVATGFAAGLTLLRESLYRRARQDVERAIGLDSMLLPVSELKAQRQAYEEIEIYQTAEAAAAARDLGYLPADNGWFLGWLVGLRLGEHAEDPSIGKRVARYSCAAADARRLAFADALARILPESSRAPLVLFRLFPLAVQLATALAFNDWDDAAELREKESTTLPAVADCAACHARLLEPGAQCAACGNPLWKYDWLTRAD